MATKYEENDLTSSDSFVSNFYGVTWYCQTFTPQTTHSITSVKLKVTRDGSPGTMTVSIRATSSSLPITPDLTSGTIDADTFEDITASTKEISLTPYTLAAGVEYAWVVRIEGANSSNDVQIRQESGASYTRGQKAESSDSGGSWIPDATYDFVFEEWGEPIAATVTTASCRLVVGTTATGQGTITDLGSGSITAHGHCWKTTANPTTSDGVVDNGAASATGGFASTITSLTPGTGYYARAYAINAGGTSYGANVYFIASLERAGYIWMEGSNLQGFDENAVERTYIHTDDVDDTPVDAATTDPVSSNWAYDHENDVDAHGEVVITTEDANTATSVDLALTMAAGEGINTTSTGSTVTITGENASTTNKGIVQLDDTAGGTNAEVAKPPTSNVIYDHTHDDDVHDATAINVAELSAATYDDVQDFINNTLSAGRTSGGAMEASGASGDVKVNLGTGFIKISDSAIAETKSFNWSDTVISAGASAGDILDETVNYIYLDYNAGSPVPKATDDRATIELNRMFTLGRVFRSGTTLHIINSGIKLYNHTRDNHERLIQVRGFERAQGGVISETGTRYLAATAGVYFLGAGKITNDQQDTSGNGHTLTRWYHTGGNWVSNTGAEGASAAGQISNEHYDDGTDIADIGVARYGVFWVFIHFDGDLQVVYGRGSYKLADAENATVPTLPDAVSQFSILAAKIIVAQGGTNFTSVVSAYETLFPVSSPPNHWDLGGLQGGTTDEYYHLTSSEHTELNTWLDDVTLVDGGGMTLGGTLAMGANNITLDASQTVDGIDVSAHDVATTNVHGGGIGDADGDTKIQCEESADEDKIRMDVAGVEAFLLSDVGIQTLAKQSSGKIYRSVGAGAFTLQPSTYILPELDTASPDIQNEFTVATVKSGAADATEANKLHDDDASFASGDVGKRVWNTTDNTFAEVSGFVDSGELDLDTDIMVNGENYRIYDNYFTATEGGVYFVLCHFGVINLQTLKVLRIRLHINDVNTTYFDFQNQSGGDLSTKGIFIQRVSLSASDKLQIVIWCNDPNPINISYGVNGAYWEIHKLS